MKNAATASRRLTANRLAWMAIPTCAACIFACADLSDSTETVPMTSKALSESGLVEGEALGSVPAEWLNYQPAPDDMAETVRINWIHEDSKTEKQNLQKMTLKAGNALDQTVTAHITVRFSGLALETATLDLGTFELKAGGEALVSISSDEIPLQTVRGVCKAVAKMEVSDKSGYITSAGSEGIYYRNLPDYKGVQVFGEEIFYKEENGAFFDINAETAKLGLEASATTTLGRKLNENGVFEDVRAAEHAVWSAGDNAPIIITRMSSGTAPEDPEQELKEMNDAEK